MHEIARAKLLADPLEVVGLDEERGGPRHHVETGDAGQGDGDLVGQAAGEEVLRGIAGGVRERQHGNDRPRRLRRRGSERGAEDDRGETESTRNEEFHACRTPDGEAKT